MLEPLPLGISVNLWDTAMVESAVLGDVARPALHPGAGASQSVAGTAQVVATGMGSLRGHLLTLRLLVPAAFGGLHPNRPSTGWSLGTEQ